MAKTSNLREFQEAILAKLKDVASQVGAESASRLGVIVGAKKYLVRLNDLREVLPVPPILQVPLTKAWFLGTANVRGNLYNVTDLAQFLGMAPTHKSVHNRILLLSTETITQAALLIESLVGLRNLQEMQVEKLDENDDGYFAVHKFVDADKNQWLELDIERLVQDKNFIQPI